MMKHNQDGAVSSLGVYLALSVTLLIVTLVFAAWSFSSREDYKNNVDQKIDAAVSVADKQAAATEQAELAQNEKQPYLQYQGPSQYGSIGFEYPRTWSGYVNTSGGGSALVDAYFMPSILSSVSDQTGNFALRVQVLNQPYMQSLQTYIDQGGSSNTVTSTAYSLKKVPSVVGSELSGELQGSGGPLQTLVILPDRTNTIEIWTDGTSYLSDFNSVILPSFTFSP